MAVNPVTTYGSTTYFDPLNREDQGGKNDETDEDEETGSTSWADDDDADDEETDEDFGFFDDLDE